MTGNRLMSLNLSAWSTSHRPSSRCWIGKPTVRRQNVQPTCYRCWSWMWHDTICLISHQSRSTICIHPQLWTYWYSAGNYISTQSTTGITLFGICLSVTLWFCWRWHHIRSSEHHCFALISFPQNNDLKSCNWLIGKVPTYDYDDL